MVASNRKAAQTLLAFHMGARPDSRLFHGRFFFLGGSTDLNEPAPGVFEGDLSGIAAIELSPLMRPFAFPPLRTGPGDRLGPQALGAGRAERFGTDHHGERRTRLAALALSADSGIDRQTIARRGLATPRDGRARRRQVRPVSRSRFKRCWARRRSGFRKRIRAPRDSSLSAIRRPGCSGCFSITGYSMNSSRSTNWTRPIRLGTGWGRRRPGINYAIVVSTCAGMWAHVIGDTVRFESLDPPLISFTGRTRYTLSAFGEHLISEEIEAAMARSAADTGATIRDWHVGPVFVGAMGYHQFVVEFLKEPADLRAVSRIAWTQSSQIATPITWPTAYRAWGCRRRP